ncbi:MAG: hypothetical protein AB7K41_14545 [Bdellovibrionales bacterium]
MRFFIAALISILPSMAFAWDNVPGTIISPRNSIRDIVIAIDTSSASGTRQLYQVPAIYDLYITKICSTMISGSQKIVRIFNTPPGESSALIYTAGNGSFCQNWEANPILMAYSSVFAIDTDIMSGSINYHWTALYGVLVPKNSSNWN